MVEVKPAIPSLLAKLYVEERAASLTLAYVAGVAPARLPLPACVLAIWCGWESSGDEQLPFRATNQRIPSARVFSKSATFSDWCFFSFFFDDSEALFLLHIDPIVLVLQENLQPLNFWNCKKQTLFLLIKTLITWWLRSRHSWFPIIQKLQSRPRSGRLFHQNDI